MQRLTNLAAVSCSSGEVRSLTAQTHQIWYEPGGAAPPKIGTACLKRIWCEMGDQNLKNCVELCGHKNGSEIHITLTPKKSSHNQACIPTLI